MKIQGINISSILKPEARYIVLSKKFVSSLADSFPSFTSYNESGIKIRELIVFNKKRMYTGYKYTVNTKSDGGLTSLTDEDEVLVSLRAKKYDNILTTELRFLGIKNDKPDKLLILYDVPVIGRNREELVNEIKEFLKLWDGIVVKDIPAKIKPEYKRQVKAKIVDIDYADLLFTT